MCLPEHNEFDDCVYDLMMNSKRPRCYSMKNTNPESQCFFLETEYGVAISTTLAVSKSKSNSWSEFLGFVDHYYDRRFT